jgi:Zn-dependent peptidase ImmA (M78 family)
VDLPTRIKMAKQKAELLIKEEGIVALPVDVFAIALSRDIVVKPKSENVPGMSGVLMRHGNVFGIMYATHIDNSGFQRFCVAHELGHYFLEGHIDQVMKDGVHTSLSGYMSSDPYEKEADSFASGLLMPRKLVLPLLRGAEIGLDSIEKIRSTCDSSLVASAIRYVELTDEAVAIVVSGNQKIDFCFMSTTMKSLRNISWPIKGKPLPSNTATGRFCVNDCNIASGKSERYEIDAVSWFGGSKSITAIEEIVGLGAYGKTLTILSCPDIVDESFDEFDGDDEEELVDSWTPRFKR